MSDSNDGMSKSETIDKLNSDLDNLIKRLVETTIEYATENESCYDETVNFLSTVIGDLGSRNWIESFFSQEYEMRVTFTISGGMKNFEDEFAIQDIEDYIQTYANYSNCTVDVSSLDVYKA